MTPKAATTELVLKKRGYMLRKCTKDLLVMGVSVAVVCQLLTADQIASPKRHPTLQHKVQNTWLQRLKSYKVGPEEILRLRHSGKVFFVDIRTPNSYDKTHLPGSISIPFSSNTANQQNGLKTLVSNCKKWDPIVVYGTQARLWRLFTIFQRIKGLHFANVYVFPGGIEEWRECGLDLAPNKYVNSGTKGDTTAKK